MKYSDKTVSLTHIAVRLCYVLLAAAVIAYPFLMKAQKGDWYYFAMTAVHGKYLIYPFYAVVPLGYIALICLDKLLGNIKNDIVFDEKNTKLLNLITVCCIIAAVIGAVSFVIIAVIYKSIETVLLLSFGEGFMALVVRVVRNIMKKAIEIKEDNDLVV